MVLLIVKASMLIADIAVNNFIITRLCHRLYICNFIKRFCPSELTTPAGFFSPHCPSYIFLGITIINCLLSNLLKHPHPLLGTDDFVFSINLTVMECAGK